MAAMADRQSLQGTAIVLDGKGIFITGPSGSGKSLLALQLLESAKIRGQDAFLVSDDLVYIEAESSVVLHAPDHLQGQVELRGAGIIARPFQPAAKLSLLVEFIDQTERLPEVDDLFGMVDGVSVPRRALMPFPKMAIEQQVLIVRDALGMS